MQYGEMDYMYCPKVLCLFKVRYVCLLQIQIIEFPFILVHHVLYLMTAMSIKALCF